MRPYTSLCFGSLFWHMLNILTVFIYTWFTSGSACNISQSCSLGIWKNNVWPNIYEWNYFHCIYLFIQFTGKKRKKAIEINSIVFLLSWLIWYYGSSSVCMRNWFLQKLNGAIHLISRGDLLRLDLIVWYKLWPYDTNSTCEEVEPVAFPKSPRIFSFLSEFDVLEAWLLDFSWTVQRQCLL